MKILRQILSHFSFTLSARAGAPMKPARLVGKERASNEQIVFELSETS